MIFSETLIPRLRERLRQPLPGLNAQMRMAPPIRGRVYAVPPDAHRSAVLALLYPHRAQFYLAFMQRSEDGRVHSGQISFPGGRHEPADRDFVHTALREAEEEMGIPAEKVEVLGSLTELYIPPSNSLVYPAVGYLDHRPAFVLNPQEVAAAVEVEVARFWQENVHGIHEVDVFNGTYIQAPGYTIDGRLIWGATAMMVAELMAVLESLD